MTVTTRDGYVAAAVAAQRVRLFKSANRAAAATIPFSVYDLAGAPGAGVLNIANTANGVVPTDATAGHPAINAFGVGAQGLITRVTASNLVPCVIGIYDLLFKAGAYAFGANTTLTAQPSYAGRVPGGTDFNGTELWLEAVTAFTGNQTCQINYLDQDGNAGDTGAVATNVAPIVGRMYRMPLAAGDSGISQIAQVRSTISSAGTFNVLVLRNLWQGRIRLANDQIVHGGDLTGLPQVFADSALMMIVTPDSTATSFPEAFVDIGNG